MRKLIFFLGFVLSFFGSQSQQSFTDTYPYAEEFKCLERNGQIDNHSVTTFAKDGTDLLELLSDFGCTGSCSVDYDGDSTKTDIQDVLMFLPLFQVISDVDLNQLQLEGFSGLSDIVQYSPNLIVDGYELQDPPFDDGIFAPTVFEWINGQVNILSFDLILFGDFEGVTYTVTYKYSR